MVFLTRARTSRRVSTPHLHRFREFAVAKFLTSRVRLVWPVPCTNPLAYRVCVSRSWEGRGGVDGFSPYDVRGSARGSASHACMPNPKRSCREHGPFGPLFSH